MVSDEVLWTVPQVAKYLQVSPSWVYRNASSGRIPTVRLGANLRFVPSEIKSWALEGR